MIKLILLLISFDCYGGISDEIKSNDLKWNTISKQSVPSSAYQVIMKDLNYMPNESFAFVDLNYDNKDEIIVKSTSLGGAFLDAYLFYENKNNKWQHLITFTGGFILTNQHPDYYNKKYSEKDRMYYTITQWQRVGSAETWQSVYVYRNNKYREVDSQRVPLTVLYQKDFQKMLLEINFHPSNGYFN